ncbi:MAG: hypothetical protein ACJ73J_02195 [Actinomycetes bacterium]
MARYSISRLALRRMRWLCAAIGVFCTAMLVPTLPANATGDTTPPGAFDLVADAGEYQTGYQVATPYNNIYVTWLPSVDDQWSVSYEVIVDDQVARVVTDAYGTDPITKRIDVPDGSHVVSVTAIDAAGNRTVATHGLDVVVDKVDPWFTSWPRLFLRTGPITDEGYPMRFTWSGDDEGTGLVAARIGPNKDCCYTLSPTLTHYDFTLPPRSETVWRMWLVDGVGRVVKTPRSGYVAPAPWSETTHSGKWRKSDDTSATDGWEWLSQRQGDRFSITTAGKSIGWVTSTGPNRGRAEVMVGKKVVATVNLYSAQRRPARVVWTSLLPKQERTTVTIVNQSPSSRPTIGVDDLLVHS